MALGQAKISLFMACLRKLILLIPLIFILPLIFAGQGFCCLFGRAGQRYHRGNRNLQRILYPL